MQQSQKSFLKSINNIQIQCFLTPIQIIINITHNSKQLQCRFNNDLMNNDLRQIFNNIQIFYKCFKKICDQWTTDNNYIVINEDNMLEVMYTLKVMKVEIKKKIILITNIKINKEQDSTLSIHKDEINGNDLSELIQQIKSIKDVKVILKSLVAQRSQDHKLIQSLILQNQTLKSIYNINLKNNEITNNFNEVAQISHKNFTMLGTYVSQIKEKMNKDINNIDKDNKFNKNLIDGLKVEVKDQMKNTSNKNVIPPTKVIFIPNNKSPFFTRFKVQDNTIKLTVNKKTQLVSTQVIPSIGIYYFSIRNVSIIAQSKSMQQFSNFDTKCINYFGGSGIINNKGNDYLVNRPFQRRQVMTVIVDVNQGVVRWLINNKEVGNAEMGQLRKQLIVPYIQMVNKDSKIQLAA